jgi:hypothetical protein
MHQRVYTLYLVFDTQGLPPGGLCPNRELVDCDESQPTAVKYYTHTYIYIYIYIYIYLLVRIGGVTIVH